MKKAGKIILLIGICLLLIGIILMIFVDMTVASIVVFLSIILNVIAINMLASNKRKG